MARSENVDRDRSGRARALAAAAAVVTLGLVVVGSTRAAFGATTSNGPNTITSGTVSLGDDAAGSTLFNVSGVVPGDVITKCINVTYSGTATSNVRLWGAIAGTGLAPYLDTTIDIGTGAAGGAGFDCTGFTSASTLHTGTLAAFGATNTSFANGLTGFEGATTGLTRSYRIVVTVANDNAAQGLSATATLTWEAQNV